MHEEPGHAAVRQNGRTLSRYDGLQPAVGGAHGGHRRDAAQAALETPPASRRRSKRGVREWRARTAKKSTVGASDEQRQAVAEDREGGGGTRRGADERARQRTRRAGARAQRAGLAGGGGGAGSPGRASAAEALACLLAPAPALAPAPPESRGPPRRAPPFSRGQALGPIARQLLRCITTRQYARLVCQWIASIGLDPSFFGTQSLRRTKATLIYRRTGNLRAVQLLLGHKKIENTARYLGIEVDDALAIAEQVDV